MRFLAVLLVMGLLAVSVLAENLNTEPQANTHNNAGSNTLKEDDDDQVFKDLADVSEDEDEDDSSEDESSGDDSSEEELPHQINNNEKFARKKRDILSKRDYIIEYVNV